MKKIIGINKITARNSSSLLERALYFNTKINLSEVSEARKKIPSLNYD